MHSILVLQGFSSTMYSKHIYIDYYVIYYYYSYVVYLLAPVIMLLY